MATVPDGNTRPEDEPLLGRAGDASQQDNRPLQFNLVLGTAVIAQVGIWLLVVTVWVSVLIHPPYTIFTPHPLLNTIGIVLIIQGILVLQPTHTPKQKTSGTRVHSILNGTAILFLLAAFIFIELNKVSHGAPHFTSAHGRLGLITYILFLVQAIIGVLQYYAQPALGGETKAKKWYKYHRISGYTIIVFTLITVCAATQTGFNAMQLHIALWSMLVTSVILLVGLLPRIKKQKLGL